MIRVQAVSVCRAAFDALIGKTHVTTLQTQPPKVPAKSTGTGHAFLPATARMPTLAEAAATTEQLRQCQEAAHQKVALHTIDVLDFNICHALSNHLMLLIST